MLRIILCLCLLLPLLGGCNGPVAMMPGGALKGPTASIASASIPAADTVIALETRPADPYSVNINAVVIAGVLHVDPTRERRWYQHMAEDDRVRLRLEGTPTIYLARAETVQDPAVLERFEADRVVLRLVPRD